MGTVALNTRLFPWKTLMVADPPNVGAIWSGHEPDAHTLLKVICPPRGAIGADCPLA
jgi:hypothetical protein